MRDGVSRLMPIILVGVIVIFAIVALISLGRVMFAGKRDVPSASVTSTSNSTPKSNQTKNEPLVNSAELTSLLANRSVRMTVRGPIVADENYRTYTITISPDSRSMTTYHGYKLEQIDSKQLTNTSKAYGELVYALDRANLMIGDELTGDANDTRGICATGSLYEFELLTDDKTTKRLWTSSCTGSPGSLKANLNQVMNLFTVQIPDYATMLRMR